jgi:hypothetical protein
MVTEVSVTQVQTSGPCEESEDEKLELGSTKTQVCKRQKRFFKRFWMKDLTQIHSRMHPLVSKESDLQRRTTPGTSETVTKSQRLKQSLAAALRLASKKAFSNFAEGQTQSHYIVFPYSFRTNKSKP